MFRKWTVTTIRGKFLVLTLLLTIVPMITLSIIFYRIAEHSLGNKAEEHAVQSQRMSHNFLNATIADLNDLTNAILGNPVMQEILEKPAEDDYGYLRNAESLIKIVRAQTQTKPYIISSLIFAADGGAKQSFYQGDASIRFGGLPALEEAREYYERLRSDNRLMWHDGSPFASSAGVGNDHLYVGKLLRKTYGDYDDLGFLMLEIEKSSFFRGVSFLQPDDQSQFWVLDADGSPVYRMPREAEAEPGTLRKIASAAKEAPAVDRSWMNWEGSRAMVSYAPLDYNGWTLLYRVDASVLFADANRIGGWTIQIFLIVLLAGWVIAYRMSDTIRKPLRKLRGLMTLTGASAPHSVSFNPSDEVGQIGERFVRMMKENQELHLQIYEALLSRKEAEFRALQAQINPHFLYNTLESLNGLALANRQREMSDVIGALGKFFRISLSGGSEEITAGDEIEHVNAYVRVQLFRFRGKFEWICEVAPDVAACRVPKLILQPLVENAIYHGLKGRKEIAYLMLSASREDGDLRFSVSDDGNGIDPERLGDIRRGLEDGRSADAVGFGLRNVHERLRHYGPQYGVQIASAPGRYTTVTLAVPARAGEDQGGISLVEPLADCR